MKLYIGNLPYTATDASLSAHFAGAGAVVSANVIIDRFSGKSRGFGFVEMSDDDAKKAIEMFNGKDFEGRSLVVNEARPPKPRDFAPRNDYGPRRDDQRGGGGGYNRGR